MAAKILLAGLMVIVMSGCVKQAVSESSYSKPQIKMTKSEAVVDKPYDQAWDTLLKKLPGKTIKVVNADKKAGMITLNLKTEAPEHYINCGTAEGSFMKGDKIHKYSYRIAENYTNLILAPGKQLSGFSTEYAVFDRETLLEAIADVQVSPVKGEAKQTVVKVRAAYTWKYKAKGKAYREGMTGRTTSSKEKDQSVVVTFETNGVGKGEMKMIEGPFMCMSTGKLERDIITIAR